MGGRANDTRERATNLLAYPNLLPPGISVYRDDFAETKDGKRCLRVMVQRKADRLTHVFEVPVYKTTLYKRIGFLFPRWEPVEVIDRDRMAEELLDKGTHAVRSLAESRNATYRGAASSSSEQDEHGR